MCRWSFLKSERLNLETVTSSPPQPWYVYIVCCVDGTLYTGITCDVRRRLVEHNESPQGAKYTRARRPVSLVFVEAAASRSGAARRESSIKRMTRQAKIALVAEAYDQDRNALLAAGGSASSVRALRRV